MADMVTAFTTCDHWNAADTSCNVKHRYKKKKALSYRYLSSEPYFGMLEPTSKKGRPFSDPFDSQGDSYLEAPVLFVYTPEPVYKSEPESPHHENARV